MIDTPTITLIRGGSATTRPVERLEDSVIALLDWKAELEAEGYHPMRWTHSTDDHREMTHIHLETPSGQRALLTLTEYT